MMQTAVILTPEDYTQLMSTIKEDVSKVLSEEIQRQHEKPVTIDKAAKHCGIGVKGFERWIREGVIPDYLIHTIGTSKRFFLSELNEFIKNNNKVKKLKVA